MNHRDATELLLGFAEGALDEVTSNEMRHHVDACKDCREWLSTFALLSDMPRGSTHPSHPDTLELAACAVRPEEEFEPDHQYLRSHLSSCGTCRQDVDAVRRAVVDARPIAESCTASPSTPVPQTTWWWSVAAATGLVGLAIGVILGGGISPGIPNESSSNAHEIAAAGHVAPGVPTISHASIDGRRLIRSEEQITIVDTSILPGASVTIQGRRGVAFGNGFQVGSNTQIEVGTLENKDPDMNLTPKGGRNEEG
jgi:hypothetical protein